MWRLLTSAIPVNNEVEVLLTNWVGVVEIQPYFFLRKTRQIPYFNIYSSFNMSAPSERLDKIFTDCFKHHPEGHAIYKNISASDLKPGACGYIDENKR